MHHSFNPTTGIMAMIAGGLLGWAIGASLPPPLARDRSARRGLGFLQMIFFGTIVGCMAYAFYCAGITAMLHHLHEQWVLFAMVGVPFVAVAWAIYRTDPTDFIATRKR